MLVDVLPLPIKIPCDIPINMESAFWLRPTGIDDQFIASRNIDMSYVDMYRYKLIWQTANSIVETTVLSVDEMDPKSLAYVNGDKPVYGLGVNLYPMMSKIYYVDPHTREVQISGYRFIRPIQKMLRSLATSRYECNDNQSIHKLIIAAAHTYLENQRNYTGYPDMQSLSELTALIKHTEGRLSTLTSADESVNYQLLRSMIPIVQLVIENISSNLDSANITDVLSNIIKLPTYHNDDGVGCILHGRDHIISTDLYDYLDPRFDQNRYSLHVHSHDIFPIDDTVIFSCSVDAQMRMMQVLNMLEMLPYTDVSFEYDGSDVLVHYAISQYGTIAGYRGAHDNTSVRATCGNISQLRDIANAMYGTLLAETPFIDRITITKTFHDDVYIQCHINGPGPDMRLYFDLSLLSLGTTGIVHDEYAGLSQEWYSLNNW